MNLMQSMYALHLQVIKTIVLIVLYLLTTAFDRCPICREQLRLDRVRKIFGIQVKRSRKVAKSDKGEKPEGTSSTATIPRPPEPTE